MVIKKTEYEDAFAPRRRAHFDKREFAVAIADGASESIFASDWAKMLTFSFARNSFLTIDSLQKRTKIIAKRWYKKVYSQSLPWFTEEKIRLGAFSTFLGVKFMADAENLDELGHWSAIGIGDSCLFQVRNNELFHSFPISSSCQFSNSPILLSTNFNLNSRLWEEVKFNNNNICKKDIFILATDALSHWFLSLYEKKEKPWNILLKFLEIESPSKFFKEWVSDLRKDKKIKNDDITLLILRF